MNQVVRKVAAVRTTSPNMFKKESRPNPQGRSSGKGHQSSGKESQKRLCLRPSTKPLSQHLRPTALNHPMETKVEVTLSQRLSTTMGNGNGAGELSGQSGDAYEVRNGTNLLTR